MQYRVFRHVSSFEPVNGRLQNQHHRSLCFCGVKYMK